MNSFVDKSVLVIGGASGIGLATAEAYIYKKAKVGILDINETALLRLSEKFDKKNVILKKGDVRSKQDIDNTINKITNQWGKIDILVYSAGVFPDHFLVNMTEKDWDDVLDINTKGAFLACQSVAKKMIEHNNGGHIITISSGSYRSARVGSAHYCASKAALVMFTRVLAQELAQHKIFVNSIAPGLIDNPILDSNYKQEFVQRIPIGRIGTGEDIASAVLMVTSELNTYITGQIIAVDGGLSTGQYGLPLSNKSIK